MLYVQSLLSLNLVLKVTDLLLGLSKLNGYVQHCWVALLCGNHSMLLSQGLQDLKKLIYVIKMKNYYYYFEYVNGTRKNEGTLIC